MKPGKEEIKEKRWGRKKALNGRMGEGMSAQMNKWMPTHIFLFFNLLRQHRLIKRF